MKWTPFALAVAAVAAVSIAGVMAVRDLPVVPGGHRRPRPAPMEIVASETLPVTLDGVTVSVGQAADRSPARVVVRTITLRISSARFHDARDVIERAVASAGGTVVGSIANGPSTPGGRAFTETVRVPAEETERTLIAVRALGDVLREVASDEDFSSHVRVLAAQRNVAETEVARLEKLLADRGATLKDRTGVEQALASTRGVIEKYRSEEDGLRTRATQTNLVITIEGR
jgi:hypothetical protein